MSDVPICEKKKLESFSTLVSLMGDLPNCERYEKISVGLILMGDLPVHEKT
jgi:hypothetical protein